MQSQVASQPPIFDRNAKGLGETPTDCYADALRKADGVKNMATITFGEALGDFGQLDSFFNEASFFFQYSNEVEYQINTDTDNYIFVLGTDLTLDGFRITGGHVDVVEFGVPGSSLIYMENVDWDASIGLQEGIPLVTTMFFRMLEKNDLMIGSSHVDLMQGSLGNDVLKGNDGNDQLDGGAGKDRLFGGKGDDVMRGDLGSDVMTGGRGSDTFMFFFLGESDDAARDVVRDFNDTGPIAQQDMIFMEQNRYDDMRTTQVGADVDLYIIGVGHLLLQNCLVANLGIDDFILV